MRVNGYKDLPKDTEFCQENTDKLRDFEESIPIKIQENNNKEAQGKTDLTKEKNNENQKIIEKEKITKKNENEEKKNNGDEIVSHYKNLNQALNDFFSSEEGEEESESEEHEANK